MTPTARVEELAPAHRGRGPRAPRGRASSSRAFSTCRPSTCKGIRRILTVSADTELVSAPAYLRAAQHAPALNNFGSAISIIQDELAHAHIGYRLLGDLGVDMSALIYEREAGGVQVPVRLRPAARLVARARPGQRALRPGRLRAALRRAPVEHVRTLEARAREGRQGGDVPPAPRPHVGQEARAPTRRRRRASRPRLDWMFILTLEWFGLPDERKRHGIQLEYGFKGMTQRRAAPDVDGRGRAVHGRGRPRRARRTGTRRSERWVDRLPVPGALRRGAQARGCSTRGRSPGTRS